MDIKYALLTAILWGLCYASTEQITKVIDSKPYLVFSCFLSGILFIIWSLYDGTLVKSIHSEKIYSVAPLIAISSISSFLACFFSIEAVKYCGAFKAASVEISYPLWTLVFLWIIVGKSTYSYSSLLGAVLIFIGTLFVIRK